MVNVYIRRRKKIVFFYKRRSRRFAVQESPPLLSGSGISSFEEKLQNNGAFSPVNVLADIGFSEELPESCISEKNQLSVQESSEVEFENDATVTKRELSDNIGLSIGASLHEDETKAKAPIGIGLINNEPLLSAIQQVPSTICLQRKRRSARKFTSFDSRRRLSGLINNEPLLTVVEQVPSTECFQKRLRSARKSTPFASSRRSINEFSASDSLEQIASHLGAFTSVSCEINPKTPIKVDRISKFAPQSKLCGVQGLLSTGVLAGALVKYKKDDFELQGLLTASGICCGCALCKFEHVVSSLKFEKHAGAKSHNQNAHIFLENGKSLYALSKELENVSSGSLGEVMEEEFEYQENKLVYEDWKAQFYISFPKGRRSTRAVNPPLSPISKFKQVSRQLTFSDVDLQHCPVHKKRGVDIKSSKDFYLEKSSEIALAYSCQSKIGDISRKRKLSHILVGKNKSKVSSTYTPERPLLTFSFLLNNGLLERLLVNGMKDKVLFSINFEKYGGTYSRNDKSALYALGKEFGKVFGLSQGELIQKMIGFLSKESFRKNEINHQITSFEDGANLATNKLHHKRPRAERLLLSASENNLRLPLGNDAKVNFSKRAGKTMKHREQDFHQQIFELLNDGARLSYYSHGKEILEGYKFGKSIFCSCCNSMLSASKFEAHAGHEKRRKPYHSIYTSYGKSLHQIAVFLSLDKASSGPVDKDLIMASKVEGIFPFTLRYQNAYNAGEQSSSACSSFSFRFGRIFKAPCKLGSCMFCRNDDATLNYGNICDTTMLFCGQCGRMFHVGCLRIHGICDIKERPNPPDAWLCGDKCIKIRAELLKLFQEEPRTIPESLLTSLHFSIRRTLHKETKIDVHWQLLSGRFQAGKSELLLQQATQIFQEAFGAVYKGYRDVLSTMVNGERGVAEFFGGMFCAVITMKSRIVSAALLRVFGNHVAELPLATTVKERRGEGFFKILLLKIEEMLSSMKVVKLILPADVHSLPMWVDKFGFTNLSTEEIREYQIEHRIVMFENTTVLQKAVLQSQEVQNPCIQKATGG